MSDYLIKGMTTEDEWNWVAARAECVRSADSKGMVAYRNGEIVCAVAFDHWSHNSVHIHTAFEDLMCFKHGWPEAVFGWIFNDCDKGIIMGITPACNEKALRFNKHIGFEEIFRVKDGFEVGIDFVVTEYRKENCKYIEVNHGQESSRAA